MPIGPGIADVRGSIATFTNENGRPFTADFVVGSLATLRISTF